MTTAEGTGLCALICADYARFSDLARGGAGSGRGSVWLVFLHPRVAPVAWFRLANWLHRRRWRRLGALVSLFVQVTFRVEIPARAEIGPGLVLPHPMGIVLGSARIGARATIFQNVTLGARCFDGAYDLSTRPILEDDVTIGTGAVVLGPVRVGAGASVAANSLVLEDVPPGGTAVGVPAQIRPTTEARA